MLVCRSALRARCRECLDSEWLSRLPADAAEQLDRHVRRRAWIRAIQLVRASDPSCGLGEAQSVVFTRQRQLGVSTDPPLPKIEELIQRVAAIQPPPAAIEALWDGDTVRDWFVVLLAIVPDAGAPQGFAERASSR